MSPQASRVVVALRVAPRVWRYGYELGVEVGLKSGSLYPILMRLSDGGLLESQWEHDPPLGRPPRHLYRLSAAGLAVAADARTAHGRQARPAGRSGPRVGLGSVS
jgi:DNA-binding PadR family transcriptional regulator